MTQQVETEQLYFEDINIGDDVAPVAKGPMSPAHESRTHGPGTHGPIASPAGMSHIVRMRWI